MKRTFIISLMISLLFFCSCTNDFEPIDYGHEACAQCKMTIMDKRYACEFITKKGKAYKFDDIGCLRKYIKEENLSEADLTIYVANYNNPAGKFLDARHAVYLHNDFFKSPMNGYTAAFAEGSSAQQYIDSLNLLLLKWENLN